MCCAIIPASAAPCSITVVQGNTIIQRLQAQTRTLKGKVDERNEVTVRQEQLINERASEVLALKQFSARSVDTHTHTHTHTCLAWRAA